MENSKEVIINTLKSKYPHNVGDIIKGSYVTIKVINVNFMVALKIEDSYIHYNGVVLNHYGEETMKNKRGELNCITMTSKDIIL
jgi:hypothetical protein